MGQTSTRGTSYSRRRVHLRFGYWTCGRHDLKSNQKRPPGKYAGCPLQMNVYFRTRNPTIIRLEPEIYPQDTFIHALRMSFMK